MENCLYTKYVEDYDHVMETSIINSDELDEFKISIIKDAGFYVNVRYDFLCGEYNRGFYVKEYYFDIARPDIESNRIYTMALGDLRESKIESIIS